MFISAFFSVNKCYGKNKCVLNNLVYLVSCGGFFLVFFLKFSGYSMTIFMYLKDLSDRLSLRVVSGPRTDEYVFHGLPMIFYGCAHAPVFYAESGTDFR